MCKFDGVSGCQAGQIARSIFVRAMPAESSVLLPAAKIVLIISQGSYHEKCKLERVCPYQVGKIGLCTFCPCNASRKFSSFTLLPCKHGASWVFKVGQQRVLCGFGALARARLAKGFSTFIRATPTQNFLALVCFANPDLNVGFCLFSFASQCKREGFEHTTDSHITNQSSRRAFGARLIEALGARTYQNNILS